MDDVRDRVERLSRTSAARSLQPSGRRLRLGQLRRLQDRTRLGAFLLQPSVAHQAAMPVESGAHAECMVAEISGPSSMVRARESWRAPRLALGRRSDLAQALRTVAARGPSARQRVAKSASMSRLLYVPRQSREGTAPTKVLTRQARVLGEPPASEDLVRSPEVKPARTTRRKETQQLSGMTRAIVPPENNLSAELRRQIAGARTPPVSRPPREAGRSSPTFARGSSTASTPPVTWGSPSTPGRVGIGYTEAAGGASQFSSANGAAPRFLIVGYAAAVRRDRDRWSAYRPDRGAPPGTPAECRTIDVQRSQPQNDASQSRADHTAPLVRSEVDVSLTNTVPVTLGQLQLSGLEVPSFFDRGGRVRVAAHQLVGGGRCLQITGFDPLRRELKGAFVGGDAAERAQLLEAMRDQAAPLLLTIGAWAELVLLTSVVIRYAERGTVIDYLVQAEVVSSAAVDDMQTEQSVLGAVANDLAYCSSVLVPAGSLSTSVASVQTSLSTAGSILIGASAGSSVPVDLTTPGTALMNVISGAGAALTSANADASPSDLVTGASSLSQASRNAGLLANATCGGAYLNRASSQLASLSGSAFTPFVHS